MKRQFLTLLILALALLLVFAGCGESNQPQETPSADSDGTTTDHESEGEVPSDSVTDTDATTDTEAVTDTDAATDSETVTDTESIPDTDAATDSESTPDTDAATDSESETDSSTTIPKCDECTWGEWQNVSEASCLKEGKKVRTCTVCGTKDTKTVPKTSCSFGNWITVTEPTLDSEGLAERSCSVCGEKEEKVIPKLETKYRITCDLGEDIDYVNVAEDGKYALQNPTLIGYTFLGWKDESGADFAASGTVTESVTVYAQWKLSETKTFAELKERLENGVDRIVIADNILLTDTIHVVGKTELYTAGNFILTRAPEFAGDLFLIGITPDGGNSIVDYGTKGELTLRVEGEGTLTFDGNKGAMQTDVKGTVFFLKNSGVLNMNAGITITNCKKVGNIRLVEDDTNMSKPERVGGAAVTIEDGVFNMYDGAITNCEVNMKDEKNTAEAERVEGYNASSCGGAVYNRSTFNMYGGIISGNKAARGGAIYNYRVCRLIGGTIENNYATVYGGALYAVDSQYAETYIGEENVATKLYIRGNSSEKSGGAVFSQHMGTIIIYGGVEFAGNKSLTSNGGAINAAGAVTIKGGLFKENLAASKGGALYVYYSDSAQTVREVYILGGTFEANGAAKGGAIGIGASKKDYPTGAPVIVGGGVMFINNVAFCTEQEDPSFIDNFDREGVEKKENGEGGAIYVVWKGNLTINGNALFEGNHAGNKGGAIYATTAGSKVKISATETAQPMFLKNTAGGNGGAIYCYTDVDADIDYAIFRENTSASTTYGGGAFYSSGANVSLKNVLFDGNTSDFNGGAIALYSSSEATFENVNFLRNGADNLGGALYINKSTLGLKNIFAENNAALRGGAFYCTSGAEVISTEGQVTFESNTAIERGGAVYLSKSTFDIKDLYVAYNKAGMDEATRVEDQSFGGAFGVYTTSTVTIGSLTAESNTSYDKGGVMYISGSTVTVNGGEVFGNASANANGGAFSVHSDGALTLNDVSVHDNTAKKNGGAIYVNAATLNGAGSIFAANKCGATDQGGGAMYLTDATVKMSNLTLNGNESPNNGGAIYTAEGSNVTLTGVNAYGNTAGKTGGFAYVEAATMTVQAATDFAATINQNTAADNGGAFAVYERGTLKLYDVECSENVATVGNGGAVFAYGSDLVLGDETNTATIVMNNNTAGKYGGAIAVMEIAKDEEAGIPEAIPASATIHTLELQENHSAKYGGAMYLNDAVVTVTGSLDLYANSADSRGGAVYTTATVFTAADVSADANTCGLNEETRGDGFGGAFCIYSKSEITIATLTASGNTSYEKGGFMYISGSTVVIENGEIEDNTSETANGGGFSVHSGGTVKLYGVTMSGNSAENGNGGALYVYGANAVVGDAEHTDVNAFTGNKAKDGAAIYVSGKTANASLSAHTIVANENVSTGGGAALYVTSDDAGANTTTVSITSLTANKNTATGNGGALYVYNYANVVIDTLNASENSTAGTYGGGVIYASGVSKLEIKNVTATKNTATEKGGFLYLTKTGTVVTIHSGSVSDNTSSASTHATIWSNSQGAKLEINLSAFTYPDGSITGKDNFAITDITPAEANA